jgi:hypothetical protein
MLDDQESKILIEVATQEKSPQNLLEIVLALAAAIHEQRSHGETQVSAA